MANYDIVKYPLMIIKFKLDRGGIEVESKNCATLPDSYLAAAYRLMQKELQIAHRRDINLGGQK